MTGPYRGEISSAALRAFTGGELPPEGWITVELHGQVDAIGPSELHPDLSEVRVAVPPPVRRGDDDPREEALADFISRHTQAGAGIEETARHDPRAAALYRDLAAALVPWLAGAEERDRKAAWERGYEAGRQHRAAHPSPALVRSLIQMVPRELLLLDLTDAEPVEDAPPPLPANVRVLLEAARPLLAPSDQPTPVE